MTDASPPAAAVRPNTAGVRVDLVPHRNNLGATAIDQLSQGGLNVWRNSMPAAELPTGRRVVIDGIGFDFPPVGQGHPDNVRCQGQFVEVPEGDYDWLAVLATAERRVEDEIAFHFLDGSVDFEPLRISDFWAAPAVFGETEAMRTSAMHYPNHVQQRVPATIWCQRVPVTRRAPLRGFRLPPNIAVHLFAATLVPRRQGAST